MPLSWRISDATARVAITSAGKLFPSTPQNQCGSGLAREGGVSVSTSDTDKPHSRASPLPHFFTVLCQANCAAA
ncbi:hypothetical protein DYL59_17180 [Pseudomonas kairouanensis]|uniref:Uncharacterized protein n=1 Tax=Pseudomonas kairouanensis TaxID=2293832 RepID=A0A4Z0AN32_9PSED|nr:hypothetical protein DYL59_17180 [Pseudomonas kairouanensis]